MFVVVVGVAGVDVVVGVAGVDVVGVGVGGVGVSVLLFEIDFAVFSPIAV